MTYEPAHQDSALEFCALIQAKESTPTGSMSLAILDDGQRATLSSLIAAYTRSGPSAELERRARVFLTSYQEWTRNTGILDEGESQRLATILSKGRHPSAGGYSPAKPSRTGENWWREALAPYLPDSAVVLIAAGTMVLVALAIIVFGILRSQTTGQSVGTGAVPQHPAIQQIPAAPTDLQKTESLFGTWNTVTPSDQRPQTDSPAVLLLSSGGYQASGKWQVPASSPGWQDDQSGAIVDISLHGTYADVTDADGNPYVVGVGQAFILASTPDRVFHINENATPQYLTLAQAVAARHHL